jgi:hypothetical protein
MGDQSELREVPSEFTRKRNVWRILEKVFAMLHILLSGGSVVLGTVIAANVKSTFLSENWALVIAASAARTGT